MLLSCIVGNVGPDVLEAHADMLTCYGKHILSFLVSARRASAGGGTKMALMS